MKIERTEEFLMAGVEHQKKMTVKDENIGFMLSNFYRYSDPVGSMIREILTNGIDSLDEAENIKNGVYTDSELIENKLFTYEELDEIKTYFSNWERADVQINLSPYDDQYRLIITDYGVGLSPNRIENIYGHMFSSTKRSDNRERGAFGLGAKSPLAYSDYYEVETSYLGKLYRYLIRKTQAEPELELVYSTNSASKINYTSIIIPIKPIDIPTVSRSIKYNTMFFDNVKSNTCEKPKIYKKEYFSFSTAISDLALRGVLLNIGNIPYKLQNALLIQTLSEVLTEGKFVDSVLQVLSGSNFALNFEVGELDILWHREDIEYTEKTRKAIVNKLSLATVEINNHISEYTSLPLVERIKLYLSNDRLRSKEIWIFDGLCKIDIKYVNERCPITSVIKERNLFEDYKFLSTNMLHRYECKNTILVKSFVNFKYYSNAKTKVLKKYTNDKDLGRYETRKVLFLDEDSKEFLSKSLHRQVYVWKTNTVDSIMVSIIPPFNKDHILKVLNIIKSFYKLYSEFGLEYYYNNSTSISTKDTHTLLCLNSVQKQYLDELVAYVDSLQPMWLDMQRSISRLYKLSNITHKYYDFRYIIEDMTSFNFEHKKVPLSRFTYIFKLIKEKTFNSVYKDFGIFIDEVNLLLQAYVEYTYGNEDYVSHDSITPEDISEFKEKEYKLQTKKESIVAKDNLKLTANFFWYKSVDEVEYLSNNHTRLFTEKDKDKLVIYGYSTDITYLYAVVKVLSYIISSLLLRRQIEIIRITKAMESDVVNFFPNAVYVSEFISHAKLQNKKLTKHTKEGKYLIRSVTIHKIMDYLHLNNMSKYDLEQLCADERVKKYVPSLYKSLKTIRHYLRDIRNPAESTYVKTVNNELLRIILKTFNDYQLIDPYIESEMHMLEKYIKEFPALFNLLKYTQSTSEIEDYLESKLSKYNATSLIHFRRLREKKMRDELKAQIKEEYNRELKNRIIPAIRKKAIADFTKSLQVK